MTPDVIPIRCYSDNYAYLVPIGDEALVVDPAAYEPVEQALTARGLRLGAILNTHHHGDHVGGNEPLRRQWPGASIYAHRLDRGRVPGQTDDVEDGQPFEVAGISILPLHVPGHTRAGVAYQIGDAVFTGDTLFVAGCGRLFEGTAREMFDSLGKLAALSASTRVFCGHEYTVTNLRFARSLEPDRDALAERLAWAEEQTERGQPTVPSTIGDERSTNPFLRCAEPTVVERFGGRSPVEVFAEIRRRKDAW